MHPRAHLRVARQRRFMIDRRYQRLGLGARAMRLVIERVRGLPGAVELLGPGPLSCSSGTRRAA